MNVSKKEGPDTVVLFRALVDRKINEISEQSESSETH